jgi:hypothetical protein
VSSRSPVRGHGRFEMSQGSVVLDPTELEREAPGSTAQSKARSLQRLPQLDPLRGLMLTLATCRRPHWALQLSPVSSSALPLLELSCRSRIGYSSTKRLRYSTRRQKPICNRLVRDRLSLTTLFSRGSPCDASPVSPPATFRAARRRWARLHCGRARVCAIIIAKLVEVQPTDRTLTWTNR